VRAAPPALRRDDPRRNRFETVKESLDLGRRVVMDLRGGVGLVKLRPERLVIASSARDYDVTARCRLVQIASHHVAGIRGRDEAEGQAEDKACGLCQVDDCAQVQVSEHGVPVGEVCCADGDAAGRGPEQPGARRDEGVVIDVGHTR
jgi:hypothetical protein